MTVGARGARHLLIGLDGVGLDVVRALGRRQLPTLHGCMDRGAFAALRSVLPPATLPNWATLLTGANPGRHGVFDFTLRRGYRVQFTAGSIRALPTLVAQLDRQGLCCASLFFPGTFPPERLARGYYVSGWDAPVAFEADASFVWPRSLYREIVARFGPERFDDVDEFSADTPGWHSQLPAALCARIERRAALGSWLLERERFDLFAIYFGESDTASHHLWSLHDPGSPRRPARVSHSDEDGLARVYRSLDRAVAELLAAAGGEQVELTLVSDHGSGGSSDKVLYLNRALAAAGLLTFHERPKLAHGFALAKRLALSQLSPALRERVFRSLDARLPGFVESQTRFGAIDMRRTRVFSDELNYFPALHYNLQGREPRGQVRAGEIPELRLAVERALYALRDPWSDARVVKHVHAREELFHGAYLDRAPDLLLELELDRGYSYNLMPSLAAEGGKARFRRLRPDEYLGRKGRSLAGSHRNQGIWVAAGPSIAPVGELEAAIADVSATVLARLGVNPLQAIDGQVVHAALTASPSQRSSRSTDRDHSECTESVTVDRSAADNARVAARLRRLGYIE